MAEFKAEINNGNVMYFICLVANRKEESTVSMINFDVQSEDRIELNM